MQLKETLTYGAAPDAVFAMLCDTSWRERVCELARATSYDVHVDDRGDDVTVTVRRVIPADLPDGIRKFLGDTVEVEQEERWGPPDAGGTRRAGIRVRIKGQPASMEGTSVLSGDASGSTLQVTGDVRVKVPFLGAKIEPEVAKAIVGALRIEERSAVEYLA